MIIKKYKSVVTSLLNPVQGIYTLEFKSLSGDYKYVPGQFLHLALDADYDGTGQWPESRCFSMQSNPDETNIRITYAVKGRFTTMIERQLRTGSEVWLKLPYGDLFTNNHNKVNTVFIAGGTGITPFLSLFTHSSFYDYESPKLYLGFRSSDLNIYQAELNRSCNSYQFVKFFYENIDGQLNIQQILIENGPSNDYFISGPPTMIKSFRNYLKTSGVPGNQIKTDDWE
jgi:ferredoxin-NADP reductase